MESGSAKAQADPYKTLCDDVKTFITSFHHHIKTNNLVEIENDYAVKFPKLTEQYFKSTRWPSAEIIAPLVNKGTSLTKPNKPKSNINAQLNCYAAQRDPNEVAGTFGRVYLYKMLGFFSLVGLCRVHCLLGDYYTALKMLENVIFSRQEMYHEVPTCHITTGYYVGFAYMMMRRFQDAIRTFASTLSYISRSSSFVSQRQDLRDYVVKQSDQMTSLLAICLTINPMPIDQSVEQHLREKYAESLNRLQQTNKDEFTMCFDMGCPRFVNPDTANDRSDYSLDAQRHQGYVFREELENLLDLPRLRSYLKLYTTLPVSKLSMFLREKDENVVHSQLMRFKHLLKNVTSTRETCGSLEGQLQLLCDTDFYVDGDMIHIADMKVDRRFSEFFMLQLEKLHQVNNNLDELENRLSSFRARK
nr:unnamed protein product [Spirometra erinaceieuropaei]